jgi:hypothetical protein
MKLPPFAACLILTWLFLPAGPGVLAQATFVVSGTVLDSASGKPMPFAQVCLKGTHLGTAANDDGLFQLNIPAIRQGDTLLVAYMGYRVEKVPLPPGSGVRLEIRLRAQPLELREVEIIALTPGEVIRQCVAHIPENYGVNPLVLTAFIRSQKYLNNRLAEYTEAVIGDRKNGYGLIERRKTEERKLESNVPQLLKGRVVSDTSLVNAMGDVARSAGCLGCNFVNDFAEFHYNTVLDEKLFESYHFKMEEESRPEGGKVYHIWFDQRKGMKKQLWKGEVFIDAADFALVKITQRPSFEGYETYEKGKFRRQFILYGTPGWIEEMPLLELTTTYEPRSDAWCLATIRIRNTMTFTQPATGKKVHITYRNDVVVTDMTRDSAAVATFRGDKSLGGTERWDELVGQGEGAFWENMNYLPVEEKLGQDLEKLLKGNSRK